LWHLTAQSSSRLPTLQPLPSPFHRLSFQLAIRSMCNQ
jgi:hypothetical protein